MNNQNKKLKTSLVAPFETARKTWDAVPPAMPAAEKEPPKPKAEDKLPRGIRRRPGSPSLYAFLTHPPDEKHPKRWREFRSIGIVSPKFAEQQRHIWQREITEGRYIKKAPRTEQALFETIADAFLDHARCYHRFWDSTESRVKRFKEWWKGLAADEISTKMIDAKLLEIKNKLGWTDTTSNEYRGSLYAVYAHAKLGFNPAADAVRYTLDNARTRELSFAEEDKLRAAITELCPHKMPELDLALMTGLRHSNMYGTRGSKRKRMEPLQWSAVNLDWKIINLPRGKKGKYSVPLNTVALAALKVLSERAPKDENGNPIGAVIRKPSGLEIYSSRKWFEACLKKAGIENLCWHALRHSHGTRLRREGVPLEDIAALLGHGLGKGSITARYAHADMDKLHEAVAKLVRKTGSATKSATVTEIESRQKKSA